MIADRKSSLQHENSLLIGSGSKSTKAANGNGIGHLKPKDLKLKKIKTRNIKYSSRSKTVEPSGQTNKEIVDDYPLSNDYPMNTKVSSKPSSPSGKN